ncbi:MAG TPA: hypothetical protein VFG19_13730 [Geobacteraceae bacterium]|nr:hypothetical protein [Geobacteraceae bacterium]
MNGMLSVKKSDFDVHSLEDEIRVDALCGDLLREFYQYLLDKHIPAGEAATLASGADYFTRDFVIARKRKNILAIMPGTVRQFAGNWYITSNLEPNIGELSGHLAGVKSFYGFLHQRGTIDGGILTEVEKECAEIDYYRDRIESFWEIRDDGYIAWERECTLKDS